MQHKGISARGPPAIAMPNSDESKCPTVTQTSFCERNAP